MNPKSARVSRLLLEPPLANKRDVTVGTVGNRVGVLIRGETVGVIKPEVKRLVVDNGLIVVGKNEVVGKNDDPPRREESNMVLVLIPGVDIEVDIVGVPSRSEPLRVKGGGI